MRSVSNINGFQNITDYKLSQVHEFAQENQFGCALTTVNLIFLHLGQYWHLATQDKTHTHMVVCAERGADMHMAQLKLLPLTVSCLSKIQIGFFLVPAHLGNPGQRAVKRVCVSLSVCVCVCVCVFARLSM